MRKLISYEYLIVFINIIILISSNNFKYKYEKNFELKCLKYPFISKYQSILKNPPNRYTVFVFHEHGANIGGLGDRLAGMLTTFAFSLRYNRTFLIDSEKSFIDYFQPYNNNTINSNITWNTREWANWNNNHMKSTHEMNCINPNPSRLFCAFDKDVPQNVVRIKSNRAYLCRWSVIESLGLSNHLRDELGVTKDTNLFDIAGCLLNLIMWPTDLLWNDVNELFQSNSQLDNTLNPMLLGFHFRCGDSSFSESSKQNINPRCVYLSKDKWLGTKFDDDTSYDSPIDFGNCGKQLISQSNNTNVIAYIASDNEASYQQINNTLQYKYTIKPTKACHVNLQQHCTSITLLHWFTLSLSDIIITQSLHITDFKSGYHDDILYPNGTVKPYEHGPISAFSRYATIYGLSMNDLHYGSECKKPNSEKLSKQTQGNWVCNPKHFF